MSGVSRAVTMILSTLSEELSTIVTRLRLTSDTRDKLIHLTQSAEHLADKFQDYEENFLK